MTLHLYDSSAPSIGICQYCVKSKASARLVYSVILQRWLLSCLKRCFSSPFSAADWSEKMLSKAKPD